MDARIEEQSILLPNLETNSAEINAALVQSGFLVRSIAPENGWLDRMFLDLTTAKV